MSYLRRRRLIKGILCLTGISAIQKILDLQSIIPFRKTTIREVTYFFPANKDYSDFEKDLRLWMDLEGWQQFITSQREIGNLLHAEEEISQSFATYRFYLKEPNTAWLFGDYATRECNVKKQIRESLGYTSKIIII